MHKPLGSGGKIMRFSVWGLRYSDALKFIGDLEHYWVESNITQGGIAIYPDGTIETDKMNRVCEKYCTKAVSGATPFEEDIMHRGA